MASLLVLNGPNLNLLGKREPEIYGSETLDEIMQSLEARACEKSQQLEHFQSNAEHEIVNRIHSARDEDVKIIIINPGAFTHTSIAIRDALLGVSIPFYEVHLSNVHAREAFRQHSYFSDRAIGVICGLGSLGYHAALNAACQQLSRVE
jgi:3-dehydroquinate dehydratase-2